MCTVVLACTRLLGVLREGLRQDLYFCTSFCVSMCTVVLACTRLLGVLREGLRQDLYFCTSFCVSMCTVVLACTRLLGVLREGFVVVFDEVADDCVEGDAADARGSACERPIHHLYRIS